MRLNLKFREQLRGLGAWITDELDQLISSIRGSWLVEHTEEDGHANITGYSLTLTKDVTATDPTKTGDVVAGGGGTFGEDVIGLSGDVSTVSVTAGPNEVGMGQLTSLIPALVEPVRFSGMLIGGGTKGFFFANRDSSGAFVGAHRQLSIWNLEFNQLAAVLQFGVNAGVPTIIDGGAASGGLALGNVPRPLTDVYVGNNGYHERGRTPALGEWTTFTPAFTSNGVGTVTVTNAVTGKYTRIGRTITINGYVLYTMAGAGAGDTVLQMVLPGGITIVGAVDVSYARINDIGAATDTVGACFTTSATPGSLFFAKMGTLAFANGVGSALQWSITCETTT